MNIKALIKTNGLLRATQIAESRMKASDPNNWSSLPVGPVFYSKDRKGGTNLNKKELTKTFHQWQDAYGKLKKLAAKGGKK